MSVIDDIALAIQRMEGWAPGNVSYRNNNPGNLRAGPGQTGVDSNGYAIFPDYETGYSALQRQVTLNVNRGLTLEEFFGGKSGVYPGYAPAADRNLPNVYAVQVSQWTGIPLGVPLSNVAGNLPDLITGGGGATSFSDVGSSGGGSSDGGAIVSPSAFMNDLANVSWFDSGGNFSPTPIAWVITVGGLVALVYGLK